MLGTALTDKQPHPQALSQCLDDLSSRSWQWYDRVYDSALKHYHQHQESDPLTRGQWRPDLVPDLQNPSFARLEARAASMLMHAVPESISSQALATRPLSTVGLLFQILKQFEPGGLGKRQKWLQSLTELASATAASEAVLTLQARTMHLQIPDGSLLLAALESMSKSLLRENAQVGFTHRVNVNDSLIKLFEEVIQGIM